MDTTEEAEDERAGGARRVESFCNSFGSSRLRKACIPECTDSIAIFLSSEKAYVMSTGGEKSMSSSVTRTGGGGSR